MLLQSIIKYKLQYTPIDRPESPDNFQSPKLWWNYTSQHARETPALLRDINIVIYIRPFYKYQNG